jgi:hypothetical protein
MPWGKNMNNSKFLALLVSSFLVFGCGVKPRDVGNNTQNQGGTGSAPPGALSTQGGKFYARPDSSDYRAGEEVAIVYNIVTTELEPVNKDYSYTAKYWMPDMPQMPVTPAKIDTPDVGKLRVTYDISMGGDWKFEIGISKNGQPVDVLGYAVTVP